VAEAPPDCHHTRRLLAGGPRPYLSGGVRGSEKLAVAVLLSAGLLPATLTHAQQPALEKALVPIVGGDTDIGIGGGAIGSLARPAPGPIPFRWKLEGAILATFKVHERSPRLEAPFQDAFLLLTLSDLWGDRLRLELRAAFTRETNLRYYGLGNASVEPAGADMPARDFFTRVHPAARARARLRAWGPMHFLVGMMYMHNWIRFGDESTLLRDNATGSEQVRNLLMIDRRHGLHLLEGALVFDTRDDEIAPSRGMFHQVEVRISPWQTRALPYRYGGLSAQFRFFVPLDQERLVLAVRAVGDVAVGDVPFYELSRLDETSALGGAKFLRGVPSNRYWGQRKVLGNLELRAMLFGFGLGDSRYRLGMAGFFDSGRVWASWHEAAPALDGRGLGLKYGVGAGLRLHKGKTFVLRADVAWSPDARPIAGYFLAGHLF
jgi:hypothetical protein